MLASSGEMEERTPQLFPMGSILLDRLYWSDLSTQYPFRSEWKADTLIFNVKITLGPGPCFLMVLVWLLPAQALGHQG